MDSHQDIPRPYFSFPTAELLSLAAEGDDLAAQLTILYELQFRHPKSLQANNKRTELTKQVLSILLATLYKASEKRAEENREQVSYEHQPPKTLLSQDYRKNYRKMGAVDWHVVGVLKASGYVVGKTHGKPERERRRILDDLVLEDDLSDIEDKAYASEFGAPGTAQRLKKIANSLSSFAKNAGKNNHNDNSSAIHAWQQDLQYLKEKHYAGHYSFAWPSTVLTA